MRTRNRTTQKWDAIAIQQVRRAWRDRSVPSGSLLSLPPIDALQHSLDRLSQCGPKARKITLLLLDLHKFKRINRIYGHAAGNALLSCIEARFAGLSAPGPMFHLGGDEFAFLHRDEGQTSSEDLARTLITALAPPFDVLGHSVQMNASIGLACCTGLPLTAAQLLHQASIALAHARKLGSGKSAFFALDATQRECLGHILAGELPRALHNGEVRPYYQPIVSLTHNTVSGYEALARWQHPLHGLILPSTFLPIAEEMGLMDDLLFAMAEQACRDVQALPGPMGIAMNLSPRQLDREAIILDLIAMIRASGIPTRLVTLEVTEDRRTSNPEAAKRSIAMLREAGVRIALDDFGSGYTNLKRLAHFPPDSLKIDRGLIRACDTAMGQKLLSSVIDLGHRLHLPIVAEGIETPAQARCLTEMGCDYAQGFLFGHPRPTPMPLDESPQDPGY